MVLDKMTRQLCVYVRTYIRACVPVPEQSYKVRGYAEFLLHFIRKLNVWLYISVNVIFNLTEVSLT